MLDATATPLLITETTTNSYISIPFSSVLSRFVVISYDAE